MSQSVSLLVLAMTNLFLFKPHKAVYKYLELSLEIVMEYDTPDIFSGASVNLAKVRGQVAQFGGPRSGGPLWVIS